jgi:hypothetical protein
MYCPARKEGIQNGTIKTDKTSYSQCQDFLGQFKEFCFLYLRKTGFSSKLSKHKIIKWGQSDVDRANKKSVLRRASLRHIPLLIFLGCLCERERILFLHASLKTLTNFKDVPKAASEFLF